MWSQKRWLVSSPSLAGTQSRQDAVLVPVLVKGALAAGIDHPVDGGQHQILTHTELGTTLGLHRRHMGVDQAHQSQAVRPVPQPGGGSELAVLKTAQRRRAGCRTPGIGPLNLLQDPIAAAEVDLLDDPGLAVDALGFDPVSVQMALFELVDQARHRWVIH